MAMPKRGKSDCGGKRPLVERLGDIVGEGERKDCCRGRALCQSPQSGAAGARPCSTGRYPLGQKYIVEQNSLQDPGIDYLSLEAEAFKNRVAYDQNQISANPAVYYPKGGCVGNVVEFECVAEKRFRLTHTAEGSEEARWVFKELKLCIKVVALSKYGAVPYEECFHLSSETDSTAKVLEHFRSVYLHREGYVLRPITEKENAVFLTVEPDEYYLDSRLRAVMLGPFGRCRLEKEIAECFYDDETDSYIPLVRTIPLCRFDWAMRPMDPSIFEDD